MIGGKPFVIKKWTTNLSLTQNSLTRMPRWVKLFGVPLKLWTFQGMSYIPSALGKPLYMDKVTKEASKIGFARVCIEFDLAARFSGEFDLKLPNGDTVAVTVEYQWKPKYCC